MLLPETLFVRHYSLYLKVPASFLINGSYSIDLVFVKNTSSAVYEFEECLSFDVEDFREHTAWYGDWPGAVRPNFKVLLQQDNV